jgi:hypothetical protein
VGVGEGAGRVGQAAGTVHDRHAAVGARQGRAGRHEDAFLVAAGVDETEPVGGLDRVAQREFRGAGIGENGLGGVFGENERHGLGAGENRVFRQSENAAVNCDVVSFRLRR